jgi:predicted nucleic acid-binding protein
VERALATGDGVVSSQIVQEFLNVALRKFERPLSDGQEIESLTVVNPF